MNIALLTISDTRTQQNDASGTILKKMAEQDGHNVIEQKIVQDDKKQIQNAILAWCKKKTIDVIITTGGTGITKRDVTPEAVKAIIEKDIEGFGEMFRMLSYQKIKTSAIQSRAIAGVAQKTFIFALPGSPSACKDAWQMLLRHQLDETTKPCNLAMMLPKL